MPTLNAALESLLALIALIRNGWEFPDAAFRTARRFGVKQTELEAAYDQL